MKKIITAVALAGALLVPTAAQAASSTKPVLSSTVSGYRVTYRVSATVTVDGPSTVTLTNSAYRHAEQTQATVVAMEAGVVIISDVCSPYRLDHTWNVYVDGVKVASTSGINCR